MKGAKAKAMRTLDPAKLSPGVRALNPGLFASSPSAPESMPPTIPKKSGATKVNARKRGKRTQPEIQMAMILERRKRSGEIVSYSEQGITLLYADDGENQPLRYKGDFLVVESITEAGARIVIIETKGPHIRSRDIVRFKAARAQHRWARFEMHQLTRDGWSQIL